MVAVNEQAPEFTLKDENNQDVRLSQFRGRNVLLAFFPFAFSPVCTTEHTCFENDMHEFSGLDVQVLGISVDSHWAQSAFKKSLGISFPLLSDFGKEAARSYGVLRSEGFSERAYFLVDKNGIIRYTHVMASPGTRLENSELIAALKNL